MVAINPYATAITTTDIDGISYIVTLRGDERVITARYYQRCTNCNIIIAANEKAIWSPNNSSLRHIECPGVILPTRQEPHVPAMTYTTYRDPAELDSRIRATQLTLSGLLEERETVASWGSDADYPIDTVLSWTKTMHGKTYTWVALKVAAHHWYLTGSQGRDHLSFGPLVTEHLAKADTVWIATAWEQVSR